MQRHTGQQWVNSCGSADSGQTSASAPKSLLDIYISQPKAESRTHQGLIPLIINTFSDSDWA
eukprot:767471-Amphidinium_carterae.1